MKHEKGCCKGLPVIRQVQMVIGVLLLAASYLVWTVSVGFIAVCAFIGVALVVAGFTGVCPMERVLERMPWNKECACEDK